MSLAKNPMTSVFFFPRKKNSVDEMNTLSISKKLLPKLKFIYLFIFLFSVQYFKRECYQNLNFTYLSRSILIVPDLSQNGSGWLVLQFG